MKLLPYLHSPIALLSVLPTLLVNGKTLQVDWTGSGSGPQQLPSPKSIKLNVCDSIQFQSSPDTDLWLLPDKRSWRRCQFTDTDGATAGASGTAVQLRKTGSRSHPYYLRLECMCVDGSAEGTRRRYLASRSGCEAGKKLKVTIKPVIKQSNGRCHQPRCGRTREYDGIMTEKGCKRKLKRGARDEIWLGYEYIRSSGRCKLFECRPDLENTLNSDYVCARVIDCSPDGQREM